MFAQPTEEQEPEVSPPEAVAMVEVSESRTFGEFAQGVNSYFKAMGKVLNGKIQRVREIDRELNE